MQTYRVETMVSSNRTLTIKGLPFQAGEEVEVFVRGGGGEREVGERYPLRGKPLLFFDPFVIIAESDWEALQ